MDERSQCEDAVFGQDLPEAILNCRQIQVSILDFTGSMGRPRQIPGKHRPGGLQYSGKGPHQRQQFEKAELVVAKTAPILKINDQLVGRIQSLFAPHLLPDPDA